VYRGGTLWVRKRPLEDDSGGRFCFWRSLILRVRKANQGLSPLILRYFRGSIYLLEL
jgi:hypothetical protein